MLVSGNPQSLIQDSVGKKRYLQRCFCHFQGLKQVLGTNSKDFPALEPLQGFQPGFCVSADPLRP